MHWGGKLGVSSSINWGVSQCLRVCRHDRRDGPWGTLRSVLRWVFTTGSHYREFLSPRASLWPISPRDLYTLVVLGLTSPTCQTDLPVCLIIGLILSLFSSYEVGNGPLEVREVWGAAEHVSPLPLM